MSKISSLKPVLVFNDSVMLKGEWTVSYYPEILSEAEQISEMHADKIVLNGEHIGQIDSTGAWVINKLMHKLSRNTEVVLQGFNKQQLKLLEEIRKITTNDSDFTIKTNMSIVEKIGYQFYIKVRNILLFINFIGEVSVNFFRVAMLPKRLSWGQLFAAINDAGVNAIPIVSLLSFLIGIVLAYQMGLQLETYGANIYIAYYSGMAMLREFSPLITAIIAAGRTSSAYTALIGMMKVDEEIDALNTMGISAYERLVVPRVLGLLIVIPLLTFLADVFGVLGCMVMSKYMLHVEMIDYLYRLQNELQLEHYLIGIGKAPVFSLIISLVGCFQGFRVELGADSVGKNTTRSVVQAIFLIIIADAIFSIVFSWQGV